MIISRTPLRISFAGGGTDLREYYRTGHGCVVSTAIKKYVYVTVNRRFDTTVRVSYSKTETVGSATEVSHPLIREAMHQAGVTQQVEITTVADVPGRGTGLGSSSSLTVGALHALHAYRGQHRSAKALAEEACRVEIDSLGEPIGKQDQYASAYGGLNYIQFNADESTLVEPIIMAKGTRQELERRLMSFHSGVDRQSREVLTEQKEEVPSKLPILDAMRDQAKDLRDALHANDLTRFGEVLHEGWLLKRSLATRISSDFLDGLYERARAAGALGGKISGAGGGGFLTLYCEEAKQDKVREALGELREMRVRLDPQGSRIIFVEEDHD